MKRGVIVSLAGVTLVIVAIMSLVVTDGGVAQTSGPGTASHPVYWLLPATTDEATAEEIGKAIAEDLSEVTGLRVVIKVQADSESMIETLTLSEGNTFGLLTADQYVRVYDQAGGNVSPGLVAVRYGYPWYYSSIYARRDSDIDTLDELDGKTWIYNDTGSTSGYVIPKDIFDTTGVQVGGKVETGGHTNSMVALIEGQGDFCTGFGTPPAPPAGWTGLEWSWGDNAEMWIWDLANDRLHEEDSRGTCTDLRRRAVNDSYSLESVLTEIGVVANIGPIPNDCLCFGLGFPVDIANAIVAAVLEQFKDETVSALWGDESFYGWTGVAPTDDSNYDGYRALLGLSIPEGRSSAGYYSVTEPLPNDTRVVVVDPSTDENGNRVADVLEELVSTEMYTRPSAEDERADVLIAFESAPTKNDLQGIRDYGGTVLDVWDDIVYGVHAALPVSIDGILAYVDSHPRIIIIEENTPNHTDLELSTTQIKVRTVWSSYDYNGNSNHAIAILDTGIDDSHSDIPRLRDWVNTLDTGELGVGKKSGWDADGHGTHVAGIAAGRGTAGGTADFSVTFSRYFPLTEGQGYFAYYPVRVGAAGKKVTARLSWDANVANDEYWINIRKPPAGVADTIGNARHGTREPLSVTTGAALSGVTNSAYAVIFGTETGDGANTGDTAYYGQVDVPYDAWDRSNLLSGVAPGCQLAGVKVLEDDGEGDTADVIEGLKWVMSNARRHNIIVANYSGSANTANNFFDAAVNTLVSKGGVSFVSVAGNDQSTSIKSPGRAKLGITVGAISDADELTNFSSVGPVGMSIKPDVLAPGGSTVTNNLVTSVDTNDRDTCKDSSGIEHLNTDQYANDYCTMFGTSMAAPHVAGLVALIADAKGSWAWGTKTDPLYAKMIILMTSTEVQAAEQVTFKPSLDRGGKDRYEGYGRVNADAAIEAVRLTTSLAAPERATLGDKPTEKKCWARKIALKAGVAYTFTLAVPAGADFDLYIYKPTPSANGEPVIAAKSTTAGKGTNERIPFTPSKAGTYYIVVKRVSGSGPFSLTK